MSFDESIQHRTIATIKIRNIATAPEVPLCPLAVHAPVPVPGQPLICFLSLGLKLNHSIILSEWTGVLCPLWCQIAFTQHNALETHPSRSVYQYWFLFIVLCFMARPSLSTHLWIDICPVAGVWLLPRRLRRTSAYKPLCGYGFSFILGKYSQGELLGHLVSVRLTPGEATGLFSTRSGPVSLASSAHDNARLSDNSHSGGNVYILHWGAFLHFPSSERCPTQIHARMSPKDTKGCPGVREEKAKNQEVGMQDESPKTCRA